MRTRFALAVATFFLLLGGLPSIGYAQRHGGGGGGGSHGGAGGFHGGGGFHRGGGFHGGGFHGGSRIIVAPSFGYGWGYPGWGWGWGNPWYYSGFGYDYGYPAQVEQINYGTVDFKVEPENAQVFIDQKLVGTVADLDHHKAYLPGGQHEIRLVAPNGQTMERSIFVAVGKKIKIDQKFEGYQ